MGRQEDDGRGGFAFEDVVLERAGVRALDGFSAEVPGHGVTVVFGPSGSGKTSLLRLCNRLEVPSAGRVTFRGRDVRDLDPLWLRRQVGMVFQRPTPFPDTVRGNLLTASPDAEPEELERALAGAALDASWLDRDATALSGGEAQRVCVARTLVTRPRVLLLDEPTSALDETATRVFEQAVRELAREGIAVLWVSHDPAQVHRIADRVLRIDRGRYSGDGLPDAGPALGPALGPDPVSDAGIESVPAIDAESEPESGTGADNEADNEAGTEAASERAAGADGGKQ